MTKKIILLIMISLLLGGCAKEAKLDNNNVVASVDGYEVKAEDLYKSLKAKNGANILIDMLDAHIANKNIKDSEELERFAKEEMAKNEKQYALYGYSWNQVLQQLGFSNNSEYLNYLKINRKKIIMVENFLKESLSEKEIQKYYDDNIYGEITAKHILIDLSEGSSEQEKYNNALNKAKDIINKLNKDEITWDKAVKEYSKDTLTNTKEGLLNPFKKDDVKGYGEEFFMAANALENGKYTVSPVKSKYGYHIIYKVFSTERPKLETKLEEIKNALIKEKQEKDQNLNSKTWVKIREKNNIKIMDTDLNEIYKGSTSNLK